MDPREDRVALKLSLRDWLFTALLVTALIAVMPRIPFRPRVPVVDRDYRMPYALSTRYDLYRRFTTLSAAQFATILLGDSVVWGQFANRDQTLAHHLNELTKQPRFVNAGLDGMHPIALAQLIEHHAPAIQRKDVIVQLDLLWMMVEDVPNPKTAQEALMNRPGLVPRLAAGSDGSVKQTLEAAFARLLRATPIERWAEVVADTRMDFLAWSLDHPYQSPLQAISAGLPPSEDFHSVRRVPWGGAESAKMDTEWPVLEEHGQWQAFERLLDLLELRQNRVLVLLGPMNEHMMRPPMLEGYQRLKKRIQEKLAIRGVPCFAAPVLRSEYYTDICHPLGAGYEELARELLKSESSWLLGTGQPR